MSNLTTAFTLGSFPFNPSRGDRLHPVSKVSKGKWNRFLVNARPLTLLLNFSQFQCNKKI
uniref:Uncharacterized protein n=1 Tax=Arion vulgaris TaxID=1028688 RepID=A0A0B6ZPM1_9EUPU